MNKKGIDVSAHQGAVDWLAVKDAGVDFAVLRAGYGKTAKQIDKRFLENYNACQAAGLPCGAYWYSYALSTADAKKEAEAAISVLTGKQLSYPVYFDIEDKTQLALSKTMLTDIVTTFCDTLERAGFYVGLYSYKSFLEQNFSEALLRRYAVWVAHTGVSQTSYKYPFGMWQHSHTGSVQGIRGKVDLDIATTDYPAIIQKAHLNGFTAPQTDCPYRKPTRVLRRGNTGQDVRWLQCRLAAKGFPCGDSGVDGSFGPATERAVRAFQAANGLETDGVCGPLTRKALSA